MKDLDKLIRLAKARLDRKSTDRGNIPKWQQTKKLDAFAAKVKSMLDPDTWAATFPREHVWLKGGPALQFWVDKDSPQEQRLVLRAIKGGFELDGPAIRCYWPMMISSMIGCWLRSAMPWRR